MTPKRAERAAKVVTLHDGGATFEVIAKQLGISYTQARNDYERAMEDARPDQARHVFAKLTRRLNRLHAAYWKKALDGTLRPPAWSSTLISSSPNCGDWRAQ